VTVTVTVTVAAAVTPTAAATAAATEKAIFNPTQTNKKMILISHALHLLNPDILKIEINNPDEITIKEPFKNWHLATATALNVGRHFAKVCKRKIKVNSRYKGIDGKVKNLESLTSPLRHYKGKGVQVIDKD
jgi:hypothetical protein